MSAALTCAVSCVASTKAVGRLPPLKRTTELLTKPLPLTARVKGPLPAVLLVGEMPLSVGTGLFTLKARTLDGPPPGAGLKTVIGNAPAVATSAAVICAVNCVQPTKL